ncbi:TetR family transcriptional regulator [bacterium]|nr:TetR family transcriptional regulator [bacterium]
MLADIAKSANVSTPAIFSHFAGKADLTVETC